MKYKLFYWQYHICTRQCSDAMLSYIISYPGKFIFLPNQDRVFMLDF